MLGYFQTALRSEDNAKSAFITSSECFAFKSMSFDLSEATSSFQKAMDNILKTLLCKSVLIYLDDIIVMEQLRRSIRDCYERFLCWYVGLALKAT